jgi:Domain of unknown function (DUF4360)
MGFHQLNARGEFNMKLTQLGIVLSMPIILGISIATTKTLAQEPSIQFGDANASGGCEVENQLLGEDGRTLSIAFKNFKATSGTPTPRARCILRVNTTIPSGFHVQDLQVLYQGTTEGNNNLLSRSYIFLGGAFGITKAPPKTTNFTSPNALFQLQDEMTAVSASCGGTGQLGMNLIAKSNQGSIVVDDANINAGDVKIHIDLVQCP